MQITLAGTPYDGSYEFDFAQELTTREWGWIKRLTGYLPLNLDEAVSGGDPEFICVLAAIALRRSGKVEASELPATFERLIDAPFGSAITIETGDEELEEDDAGPPPESSNGSERSSGVASRKSSEASTEILPPSGMHGWDTSASGSTTWGS